MERISYKGKKVSVGIDVHLNTYHVTCVIDEPIARATMAGEPEVLISFLKRFEGADVQLAYEAGFSGFELHRRLTEAGYKSLVVNASSIEVAARDRVKTDKRDSLKIAQQLARGQLKSIRIPSREEEAQRVVYRTRLQLVRKRSSIMAQIKMRFYQFGIRVTGSKEKLSLKKVEEALRNEHLGCEIKLSIRSLTSIWKYLNEEIRLIEKQQGLQAEQDARDEIYRSVPGFGPQTSRILSTELGDMSQFPNERALFSFAGLTPCEWSSGESLRKGHISRQGNSRLRWVLTEAAWNAVKYNSEIRSHFKALSNRIGKKRAIVAIARKLLGRARALFRKQERYQSQGSLRKA